MCGPKYCPMHNFKNVDWDELQRVVAQRKHERTLAAGG
jgi:phosphomethylpyrimidine synthase